MKNLFLLLLCLTGGISSHAQIRNHDIYNTEMNSSSQRTEIRIPGFDGYQTLKCDLHTHTVFSDGLVWPTIRITEAWQQGLDAIAITDHIEYRPRKEVVLGDLNESYKIAKKEGDKIGFIVIQGTEITRQKPFGHMNALFIKDANLLDVKEPEDALNEAKKQGAFVLWNHPGWPDNQSTLYPIHEQLIRDGKIDGVEVSNHMDYYPAAIDWCNDMELAYIGNSDIHGLITGDYGVNTRPFTLVFAKERSEQGVREALFARRAAACFNGQLAGKKEHLQPLLLASLAIRKIDDKTVEVTNNSDIPYRMTAAQKLLLFPAGKTVRVAVPDTDTLTVENCYISSREKLVIPVAVFFHR